MKKRVKRIRGTRTCGGGSAKKRRGKGSKGGSGNAGAFKHHFLRSLKMGIRKGKNKSQLPLQSRTAKRFYTVMNVGDLDKMAEEQMKAGKAKVDDTGTGTGIYLDATQLGIDKILGKGNVTRKLTLKTNKISTLAREKIESAGGAVEIEATSGA
ncbi:MAG: uL15 family ribosomal protein [Methanophagales archaeon]|nr:uL15 family ribosomal protein [Methanophagales archaeon]